MGDTVLDIKAKAASDGREVTDVLALLKPRVMSLVVFTATVGLLVAPGSLHPVEAFAAILFIAIGGGASGALNMWWDRDIDAIMRRTQGRPIPSGRVRAQDALTFGLWMSGFSVVMLALVTNLFAGAFLAFTIFFYVVIYSMWLKRITPQNIVIGGAAGAFPPMIGWAAVTGDVSLASIGMFLLIFMWTPPHFWALALFTKGDYADAGVPMLTVTHGPVVTRRHIFVYTLILALVAFALIPSAIGGPVYAAVALWLNLSFITGGYRIMQRDQAEAIEDNFAAERRFFKASLLYLFLHFAAFLADASLRSFGLIDWWPVLYKASLL